MKPREIQRDPSMMRKVADTAWLNVTQPAKASPTRTKHAHGILHLSFSAMDFFSKVPALEVTHYDSMSGGRPQPTVKNVLWAEDCEPRYSSSGVIVPSQSPSRRRQGSKARHELPSIFFSRLPTPL